MADTALCTVDFHGTPLVAIAVDDKPFVAVRPICDALTIDFDSQRHRIARHPVLAASAVITTGVAADGKRREVLCLPLDKLNGWLFGISSARVRDPARRERLVQYQRECFEVLASHFNRAKPAPQPAHPLPTPLSLTEWRLRYNYEGHPQFTQLVPDSLCCTVEHLAGVIRQGGRRFEEVRALLDACMQYMNDFAVRQTQREAAFRSKVAQQRQVEAGLQSAKAL